MIKLKSLLMEMPDYISVDNPSKRYNYNGKLKEYQLTVKKHLPNIIGQWKFENDSWSLRNPNFQHVTITATPWNNDSKFLEFKIMNDAGELVDSWKEPFEPTNDYQKDADRYLEIMTDELRQLLPISLEE